MSDPDDVLATPLQYLKGVGPRRAADLGHAGLGTGGDLLSRFPVRYEGRGRLEPVAPDFHPIGGSHAQWELFEETMVVCYLALERYDDATRLVRRRLERRASPRDRRWLERAAV